MTVVGEGGRRPGAVVIHPEITRLPIFNGPGSLDVPGGAEWIELAAVHHQPVLVASSTAMPTVRDLLLLAALGTAWLRRGGSADRLIDLSLRQAAIWAGYTAPGGRQCDLVRAALVRLHGLRVRSTRREGRELVASEWGLLDDLRLPSPGAPDSLLVRLSPGVAPPLLRRQGTFLDPHLFARLIARDPYAGRLWAMLEAETRIRRYRVFGPPPGEAEMPGDLPPIADLVGLHWVDRGDVIKRLRRSIGRLTSIDGRYDLRIVKSPGKGMWRLEGVRRPTFRGIGSTRVRHSKARVPVIPSTASPSAPAARTHDPRPPRGTVAPDVAPIVESVGPASDQERPESIESILGRLAPDELAQLQARGIARPKA